MPGTWKFHFFHTSFSEFQPILVLVETNKNAEGSSKPLLAKSYRI